MGNFPTTYKADEHAGIHYVQEMECSRTSGDANSRRSSSAARLPAVLQCMATEGGAGVVCSMAGRGAPPRYMPSVSTHAPTPVHTWYELTLLAKTQCIDIHTRRHTPLFSQ